MNEAKTLAFAVGQSIRAARHLHPRALAITLITSEARPEW